jgi:hypothetical protein
MSNKRPPWDNLPVPYQPHTSIPTRTLTRRQVIVIEEPVVLPEFMKQLALLCRRHPLPLPLRFLNETVSPEGLPVAIYGCRHPDCRHREGWAQDPTSGQPCKLWEGIAQLSR